jgi:hypothetical protein
MSEQPPKGDQSEQSHDSDEVEAQRSVNQDPVEQRRRSGNPDEVEARRRSDDEADVEAHMKRN